MNLSSIASSARARGAYNLTKATKHCDNAFRLKDSPHMKEAILHNDPFPKLGAVASYVKAKVYFAVSQLANHIDVIKNDIKARNKLEKGLEDTISTLKSKEK